MEIEIPVIISDKEPQGSIFLLNNLDYLLIILKRIEEEKKRFFESSDGYMKNLVVESKLKLDIQHLFIIAKIYLDYLIRYITQNFLSHIQGIKVGSFHQHVNSLTKIQNNDPIFQKYKKYISKNGVRLIYRIGNIRDILTHRTPGIKESVIYDPDISHFSIILEKDKNYTLVIGKDEVKIILNRELDHQILELAKIHNVRVEPHNKSQISRFIYLNKVLNKLEDNFKLEDMAKEINHKKTNKKYKNLIDLRKELGVVFNEKEIYQIIVDFTKGIKNILNIPGKFVRRLIY